jgi:3-oxoadipate enol-lactonase
VCQHEGVKERQIALPEVDLAIAESGHGQPIMLVHGFTGAKEDFTDWLDPLGGSGWHAVAPDLRGHGSSSKPTDEREYGFDLLASDLLHLANALEWERFVLLGHSMGGMAAQLAAIREPIRLAGLILMDTSHGPIEGLDPSIVDASVALVREQGLDVLADILASSESAPLATAAHQRLVAENPRYRSFMEAKFRSTSPEAFCALAPAFSTCRDRLDDLSTLPPDLPSLVIVGEQDSPFLAPSFAMARVLGCEPAAVISDAGHSPQFENPGEWWRSLSSFLASLPPP